jgi:hypothetical protein
MSGTRNAPAGAEGVMKVSFSRLEYQPHAAERTGFDLKAPCRRVLTHEVERNSRDGSRLDEEVTRIPGEHLPRPRPVNDPIDDYQRNVYAFWPMVAGKRLGQRSLGRFGRCERCCAGGAPQGRGRANNNDSATKSVARFRRCKIAGSQSVDHPHAERVDPRSLFELGCRHRLHVTPNSLSGVINQNLDGREFRLDGGKGVFHRIGV